LFRYLRGAGFRSPLAFKEAASNKIACRRAAFPLSIISPCMGAY